MQSISSYTNQIMDAWLKDACHFTTLRERALRGELQKSPPQEKPLLLDFIVRNGILHEAAHKNDKLFVQCLIKEGVNINSLDVDGKTPLQNTSSWELFQWLL